MNVGMKCEYWKVPCVTEELNFTFYFILNQLHLFISVHFLNLWMWELEYKESWAPKNWCFWTVVLEETLESPLDCKEIKIQLICHLSCEIFSTPLLYIAHCTATCTSAYNSIVSLNKFSSHCLLVFHSEDGNILFYSVVFSIF